MKSNSLIHLPLINNKNIPLGLYTNKTFKKENVNNYHFIIMAGGKGKASLSNYKKTKSISKSLR